MAQLLVRRNLREGMRTQGRRVALEAGAHELAVDYQQFGGGMSLNIQRALAGQMPGPFLPTELFSQRVESRHVQMLGAARWVRRHTPIVLIATIVLLVGSLAALKFPAWRRSAGAPKNLARYCTIASGSSLLPLCWRRPSCSCLAPTRSSRATRVNSRCRSDSSQRPGC